MKNYQTETEENIEEKPPVLSNWKQLYGIVFLNLVLLIILFYFFTEKFS